MSGDGREQLVGSTLGAKYKVLALIGGGSMGRLYLARHTELGRPVAVKVLKDSLSRDEKYLLRFQREAKLAASLSHPNVAHVYDYGQLEGGAPYLVMDFLEGNTLGACLQDCAVLSLANALPIFQQLCRGLSSAHSLGLVHGDLKPSNIMLVQTDGEVMAKILDFGIAKEADSQQSTTSSGEILYMSPEQCAGRDVDARSDIYSLGCVMYETLMGVAPLRGDTIVQTIYKHVHEMPLPMTGQCPDAQIPEELERIVGRAMSKDPGERFQTVAELMHQLSLVAAGQPLPATAPVVAAVQPEPAGVVENERSQKVAFRHARLLRIVGIVVLAVGCPVLLYAVRGAQRESPRYAVPTIAVKDGATLAPTRHAAPSGVVYTIYPQGNFALDFVTRRPSPNQPELSFAIPAAFTTIDNRIDGVFVTDGVIGNEDSVNKQLGGLIVIEDGTFKLLSTSKGALLTKDFLYEVRQRKGALFQQFMLVQNGKAATFRDKSKFQRRAVAQFKDGATGVVESNQDIPFTTFNGDLIWLGVRNALYTDMGEWDEGWYRRETDGKVIAIGNDRRHTEKQTNWLVYRKRQ